MSFVTRRETPSFIQANLLSSRDDDRGHVLNPVSDVELAEGRVFNFHIATVGAGKVRGDHRHPTRTEYILPLGKFLVRFQDPTGSENYEMAIGDGDSVMFTIPPLVGHAFKNVGTISGILVCWADTPYDPLDVQRDLSLFT